MKLPVVKADENKWAGEDEEDDVKDSWEDEDEEEKKDEEKPKPAPVAKVKPKSKLQEKIAERERLEQEREEEERFKNMTPEERAAEKKRLQQLQEAADLKLAMETLGVSVDGAVEGSIDSMVPTNKAEFTQLAQLISNRVCLFREKDHFPTFVEELVKNISLHLNSVDIRRIKGVVDNLYIEKQKMEKEKLKKPKKGGGKPKLRMESSAIDEGFSRFNGGGNDFDGMDDFM